VDLHQFSDWLSNTPFSQTIQVTSWAIPGIQTIHILGLATLFATALMFSLRIAGRGLSTEPLHTQAPRFARAIWFLLAILLTTGVLLIIAEPGRTITNPAFYAKMIMLAVAIGITLWLTSVARRQFGSPGGVHVAAAVIAMLLWVAIIFCGRFIAYVESN
jgi:cytochrome bd-type quinol oxidase subunit 2